jgi:hypothetical protein
MSALRSMIVVAVIVCAPMAAWANGLLYKLPADGAGVVYDLKMESKTQEMKVTGTLTLSSVGTEKIDGKNHRWIEMVMKLTFMGKDRIIVAKVLVPEDQLGKGKTPLDHCKKGWIRFEPKEAKELKDFTSRDAGPIPAFIASPLKEAKPLKSMTVMTGLGKIECKGETGSIDYKQGTNDVKVSYETRLSDKSPFGVASSKMKIQETRDGKTREVVELTLTIKSLIKNAKTTIPVKK